MRFYLLRNAFGDSLYSVWARDAHHAHEKLSNNKHVPKTEFSHIDGVSGHSFRIGACEDLGMNDFSLPVIMQAGRWKSPSMPAYYLRKITAKKSGMSRLAELQNR